jgi:hypothetical protein
VLENDPEILLGLESGVFLTFLSKPTYHVDCYGSFVGASWCPCELHPLGR